MHEPRGNIGLLRVDGSTLVGRGGSVKSKEISAGSANIMPHSFTREVQAIVVDAVGELSDGSTFNVEFEGYTALTIPSNCTSGALRNALEALPSLHAVSVTRSPIRNGIRSGFEWLVTFAHTSHETARGAGNLPLIGVNMQGCIGMNVRGFAEEVVRGTNPLHVEISGLRTGAEYGLRVTAVNSRGPGVGEIATDRVLVSKQPSPPLLPILRTSGASELEISFAPGASNGGDAVESYRVERFIGEPVPEI